MAVLTAIGMKSDPTLRGINVAIVKTDGDMLLEPIASAHFPYERDLKVWIRRAAKAALEGRHGAADIGKAEGEITAAHCVAVEEILDKAGLKRTDADVIGLHGHTILHSPAQSAVDPGRTWQIGDGATLAEEAKIDVVDGFRGADIEAGGRGTPLAPVYLRALTAQSEPADPICVLHLGANAGVTFIPANENERSLLSFDCGPGSSLIDEWTALKTNDRSSEESAPAQNGNIRTDLLRMMLLNPFLRRRPPKSLDRFSFKLDPLLELTLEDGAATLTALTAACVRKAEDLLPEAPGSWIATGDGRGDTVLMDALGKALQAPIVTAEEAEWRGDDLGAEAYAYLAVRSLKKLPLSYPNTTRAPRPILGGVYHRAPV